MDLLALTPAAATEDPKKYFKYYCIWRIVLGANVSIRSDGPISYYSLVLKNIPTEAGAGDQEHKRRLQCISDGVPIEPLLRPSPLPSDKG